MNPTPIFPNMPDEFPVALPTEADLREEISLLPQKEDTSKVPEDCSTLVVSSRDNVLGKIPAQSLGQEITPVLEQLPKETFFKVYIEHHSSESIKLFVR